MFEREDWTLFRTLPGVCQRAGVNESRLRRLLVKELVDNALDAAESCHLGMLDDDNGGFCIEDVGGFFVEDEGPGITDQVLREAKLDQQVAAALVPLRARLGRMNGRLGEQVGEHLRQYPQDSWRAPIRLLGEEMLKTTTEKMNNE